ncbi:MAG: LPS export ABC transporter permease LptG [Deferrisomatales bacterium]
MRILDRYIGAQFVRGFFLVLLTLVALFSLLEFVRELDDVGEGAYRVADAAAYIALTVPRRALDLVSVSALLGGVLSMGLLADSGELLAMRACGLSIRRICLSVLANGAVLMAGAALVAQFVAPPLEQHARLSRSRALADPGVYLTRQGFWARSGDDLVYVRRTEAGGTPVDLDIYERAPGGRLRSLIHAERAEIRGGDRWILRHVVRRDIGADGLISVERLERLPWRSPLLTSRQIAVLGLPPDTLSPSDLLTYVRTLRQRGENADAYALALWQKAAVPLATGAMVLLSLPFVFGSLRGTTAGTRIVVASLAGICFYLVDRVAGHVGLLLDLPPALPTLGPAAAAALAALWMLRRAR